MLWSSLTRWMKAKLLADPFSNTFKVVLWDFAANVRIDEQTVQQAERLVDELVRVDR